MKRKFLKRDGFTLAETLLAVLILLLVSGIVATGVPVARNVYYKTVLSANAQVMLSTAISSLRDELGTAWDVEVIDEHNIMYYSADIGWKSLMSLSWPSTATNPPITVAEYVTIKDGNVQFSSKENEPHSLVPDKNADMYVKASKIGIKNSNKDIVVIEGLDVVTNDGVSLAGIPMVEINVISADVKDRKALGGD